MALQPELGSLAIRGSGTPSSDCDYSFAHGPVVMDGEQLQKDYVELLDTANMWMFRAKAAAELAKYLNSLYAPGTNFMNENDLKKEIEMQAERLMKMHREKLTWIKDADKAQTHG